MDADLVAKGWVGGDGCNSSYLQFYECFSRPDAFPGLIYTRRENLDSSVESFN